MFSRVVPANARTHNHRPWFCEGCLPPIASIDSAVWIPGRARLPGTTRTTWLRIVATEFRPSHASCLPSSRSEGAGNAGCTLHPRSRVQFALRKAHTSIQVQRRQSGIPCAVVLTLISRSPRGTGFLAPVIGAMRSIIANLTPASRRRDHATSPSAKMPFVLRHLASTAARLAFRDDRDTPLWSRRVG